MKRFIIVAGLSLFIFFSFNSSAFCHKVRVFAYGEGDLILGEAAFAGGKGAINTEILVVDNASGKTLLTAKTDDKGQFQFTIPEEARNSRLDLKIIANAGAGHRAEWLLEAADYLLSAPEKAAAQQAVPEESVQPPPPLKEAETVSGISEEKLRAIVDDSVSRQLAPLRHYLAENSERKMSLQDILGGIGYIIGLAGLAAYMKSRKKGESHDQ